MLFARETLPLRRPGERPPFRTDVEGFRGIAVLLVVLYHVGLPGFSGGYVGVDVFFALSGYLITGILVSEVESTGSLNIARFYARRARRLLPAMAVLLVVVAVISYVFYAPIEQQTFAATALATAAYLSNAYFARWATDYLASDADANPLLHTWSLSVEEQFYIIWPILVLGLLVGLWKFRWALSRKRLLWGMAAVSAVAFGLTLALMETRFTHFAFFLSPPRAWEFALGGIAAVAPRVRWGGQRSTEALGWAGLAAVLAAGVFYGARTPFPGWTAALPVVGTLMVLRAGLATGGDVAADSPLVRMLSVRPLREAGRLSYSWYLWHWPVLVFAEGILGEQSLAARLGWLALSLGLAEASYRFVEDPVRHQRWLAGTPRRGLGLLVALTLGGIAISLTWDAALRADPVQAAYLNAATDRGGRGDCIAEVPAVALADCSIGEPSDTTVVLFGDSHAFHLLPAVEAIAAERGWRIETVMKSGCGAIDATRFYDKVKRPYEECDLWRKRAMARVADLDPDLIVMSSSVSSIAGADSSEWTSGTESLLRAFSPSGRPVLLVRDVPTPGFDAPICLSRRDWTGQQQSAAFPDDCAFDYDASQGDDVFTAQQTAADAVPSASVTSLGALVCPTARCQVQRDSVVVWRDSHHLSAAFARTLAPHLGEAMDRALRRAVPTASGLVISSSPRTRSERGV